MLGLRSSNLSAVGSYTIGSCFPFSSVVGDLPFLITCIKLLRLACLSQLHREDTPSNLMVGSGDPECKFSPSKLLSDDLGIVSECDISLIFSLAYSHRQ